MKLKSPRFVSRCECVCPPFLTEPKQISGSQQASVFLILPILVLMLLGSVELTGDLFKNRSDHGHLEDFSALFVMHLGF